MRIHVLFPLVLVACAAHEPPRAAGSPPRDEWRPLTWEDRHAAMTFRVLPNMGRLFQGYRHEDAPRLTCRTCHGQDAEEVAYAMPRALPALDPQHMPDRSRPIVAFMMDEVTPTMADLVGVDRASFSCFACHPRAR